MSGGVRIADVTHERRRVVPVGDVMGSVARGVGDLEPAAQQSLAPRQYVQVALGHRQHLAPQPVHPIPVQSHGAVDQPRRVDQMRRAQLVNVDLHVGPALQQRAGRAGVVEMDVGQQHRAWPLVAQRVQQDRQRRARPWVDQHVVHLPAPDHALATEVHDIDYAHGETNPPDPRALTARGSGGFVSPCA